MALILPGRRAIAFGALAVVAGGLVIAALLVLSGVYNVAASARHFDITDRLIKLALRRSVDTHSAFVDVADFQRPDLVRLGALHFANGCQSCHAAPGIRQNPIIAGMYPSAPPLETKVNDWDDKELFWIVRHGLKFTGMPQWVGRGRDDEVWPVVAFLRALPGMSPERYAELAEAAGSGSGSISPEDDASVLRQCIACHGDGADGPVSDMVPSLNGQKPAYLRRALEEYALDLRQSGMMEPLAAALSPDQIRNLADQFAENAPPPAQHDEPLERPTASARRGEEIALQGIPRQNVPACASCHDSAAAATFPRLAGLSQAYLKTQLHLFRDGVRAQSAHAQIMQRVARQLTDEQIEDVATFLSGALIPASPDATALTETDP